MGGDLDGALLKFRYSQMRSLLDEWDCAHYCDTSLQFDVYQKRIVVGQFDQVFFHDTVEYLDLGIS